MLASIAWLKNYVDIDVTPEVLAEKLTRVGLEVESVLHLGEGLEGVLTGRVTTIERHPNSDHLWICQMDYGSGEIVQILTGAQNVHQGLSEGYTQCKEQVLLLITVRHPFVLSLMANTNLAIVGLYCVANNHIALHL